MSEINDQGHASGGGARWRHVFESGANFGILVLCLAMAWTLVRGSSSSSPASPRPAAQRPGQPKVPIDLISLAGAPVRGADAATVAVIEYSDFQCPYCAAFVRDTLPKLESAYVASGKVLMAFRHLPLTSLHPFAVKAAEAAECAARQNKFWPMHDELFKHPDQLDAASLRSHGATIGVNPAAFDTCLGGEAARQVRADAESAQTLGIGGTPTFLIGTIQPDRRVKVSALLSGAAPFERFQQEINKILTTNVARR